MYVVFRDTHNLGIKFILHQEISYLIRFIWHTSDILIEKDEWIIKTIMQHYTIVVYIHKESPYLTVT
jgi:hypothetical protein